MMIKSTINGCYLLMALLVLGCKQQPAEEMKQQDYYQEAHRPQFHFSPEKHWMNDPNGLVYFKGAYHLFYQYYPDSTVWGPMHWGHAVSEDLLHWKHLPVALYPDSLGYIFSGSVVVDEKNTAGFQQGDDPVLVAIFTYHDMAMEKAGKINKQSQAIAYSTDGGTKWTKYAGNPVIKNPGLADFRDPKVSWHESTKSWVMPLAVGDHIEFYASPNLKEWTKTGSFGKEIGAHGGVWECPDIFPLKIAGTDSVKWVLLVSIGKGAVNGGSGTQYFLGDFDGKKFVADPSFQLPAWIDYGSDNYAGVTWFGAPSDQRLFIGWMSNWDYAQVVPTKQWRSAMTLPRQLSLQQTNDGIRLASKPVATDGLFAGNAVPLKEQNVSGESIIHEGAVLQELVCNFDVSQTTATDFGVRLFNKKGEEILIGFEKESNRFYIDRGRSGKLDFAAGFGGRHYAPRFSTAKLLNLQLFIDRSSVELFADGGLVSLTDIFFPNEDFNSISLFAKGGSATLVNGHLQPLKAIW